MRLPQRPFGAAASHGGRAENSNRGPRDCVVNRANAAAAMNEKSVLENAENNGNIANH
ncbi:hypothetical protein [Mycobacterium montefiorense]|uniref:hypothetical protein n=1 Tax=Mycobacterium montefiorense TaxID=154654 RepID=UPI0021C3CD0C|nr:hypothetical protein [Mycobacterium montefiorense]